MSFQPAVLRSALSPRLLRSTSAGPGAAVAAAARSVAARRAAKSGYRRA